MQLIIAILFVQCYVCNLIPWQLISQMCKILLTKCPKNYSPGVQYIIEHFLSSTLIFLIFLFSTTLSLLHFSCTLSLLHFSQLIYFPIYIIGWRTYFNHWSTCAWLNLLSLGIGSIRPVFAIRPWYFPIHNHKYMIITTHDICHLIALSCFKRPPGPAPMPEFDAACLIKHHSVNGAGSGMCLGLLRLELPGVAMSEICN